MLLIFALTFLMIVIGQYAFFKNRPQSKPQDNKSQATQPAAAAQVPQTETAPSGAPVKARPTAAKQGQAETETVSRTR